LKIWRLIAGVLLATISCAPALAQQQSESYMTTYNNNFIIPNGVGAITAATLHPLLGWIIASSCNVVDPTNCPLSALSGATAGLPLIGAASGGGVTQGTKSGNTNAFATVTGTLTNGDCVSVNSGNFIDAGGPCTIGGGGGTVSSGLANQLAEYAANGTTVTGTFTPNFAATGNWFSDSGANIQRWNDRTFIGGGTVLDGMVTPISKDWLTAYTSTTIDGDWPANHSVLLVETEPSSAGDIVGGGATAFTGAAQSLYSTISNNGPQGVIGWCLNNNTTLATFCWGMYAEADRQNSTVSATYGMETDVRNLGNEVPLTPYNWGANDTVAQNLACGSGVSPTPNPCSAALSIVNNGAQFDAGIVFIDNSIKQIASQTSAIALPQSYEINWFNNTGAVIDSIYADGFGNLNLNTTGNLIISGVGGVSCTTGINTLSFRSLEGIVTHC